MHGFIDSLNPLFSRYKSEIILLGCALFIAIISLTLFLQQQNGAQNTTIVTEKNETHTSIQKQTITVDISGAIKHPFVYSFNRSSRIIDAIQIAGGLTEEADEAFIRRNINYARIMSDQEKIYIPSFTDINNGVVLENKHIIDYIQPNTNGADANSNSRININAASVIELNQLPGIGPVTSNAIFNARPYTSTEDLVKNNVIKQSLYNKISELISVY